MELESGTDAPAPAGDAAKRPIRIGIEIRKPDPIESGQQRYLWRLAGWLARSGDEVHLICLRSVREGVTAPDGATLHRLHGMPRSRQMEVVAGLEWDALLLNPERSRRFRGVRANALRPAYGTEHFSQKLRSFRTPWELWPRRLLRVTPWALLERRWERAFYEAPEPPPEIVAVSRYIRGEILRSYRVPPEHVHVVPNGVDPAEFSPGERRARRAEARAEFQIPDDAFCLLFMGHNFRLKGLWELLEALGRVDSLRGGGAGGRGDPRADPIHLLVAGKGRGRAQWRKARRLIRRHGLEGRVHLAGPIRPAIRAFAAADAFIHLTWHDSFGFVTLEAMASGLPVITTPHAGGSELVEDGEAGLIVDPGRTEAVAEGILRLIDPEERARMGRVAADIGAEYPETRAFARVREILHLAAKRRARQLSTTTPSPSS